MKAYPDDPWRPLAPSDVEKIFAPLGIDWWVAGGFAVDLFLGRETRHHGDIDVATLRRDVEALRQLLDAYEFFIAHDGRLIPWHGDDLEPAHHQFWARPPDDTAWSFEVLLEGTDGPKWIYRRDPRITLPLTRFGEATPDGIPYTKPEVALLYKSNSIDVPRNAADFTAAAPHLSPNARRWLHDAIAVTNPHHPWLAQLQ
jgi:hypothetical protein